jgi:hypothetical protein
VRGSPRTTLAVATNLETPQLPWNGGPSWTWKRSCGSVELPELPHNPSTALRRTFAPNFT